MRHPLTHRQELVLAYMTMAWSRDGAWPTTRDIGAGFHFSRHNAWLHVRCLIRKGWLERYGSGSGLQYTVPPYEGVTGG